MHTTKYRPWPKRDPIKNCFLLPNELFCLGLTSGEIAVYCYLLRCEDRETYQCHPSYRTIGKATGMSQNTVRKYVAMLENKQLISTEPTMIRTKDGRVHNGSLLYTIRPIQEALDCFHERQLRKAEEDAARRRTQQKLERHHHMQAG